MESEIDLAIGSPFDDFDDVPSLVAQAVHDASGGTPWTDLDVEKRRKKEGAVKKRLNNSVAARMTIARLAETDPEGEIKSWLVKIGQMAESVNA